MIKILKDYIEEYNKNNKLSVKKYNYNEFKQVIFDYPIFKDYLLKSEEKEKLLFFMFLLNKSSIDKLINFDIYKEEEHKLLRIYAISLSNNLYSILVLLKLGLEVSSLVLIRSLIEQYQSLIVLIIKPELLFQYYEDYINLDSKKLWYKYFHIKTTTEIIKDYMVNNGFSWVEKYEKIVKNRYDNYSDLVHQDLANTVANTYIKKDEYYDSTPLNIMGNKPSRVFDVLEEILILVYLYNKIILDFYIHKEDSIVQLLKDKYYLDFKRKLFFLIDYTDKHIKIMT